MDNLFAKIPLLGNKILRELNNQTLVKFREVKKSWQLFINEEKILWVRIKNFKLGPSSDEFLS